MSSTFSLIGKHALVTGAGGYLGSEMAKALASAGATVHVNARSAERCNLLIEDIRRDGGRADAAPFDVNNQQQVDAFFETRGEHPIDILVNNAYKGAGGTIETSAPKDYLDGYEIAVAAPHRLLRASLPALRSAVERDGYASVINIASMYGMVSPDQRNYASAHATNPPFYGAAKAALIQWTRYAACEFGKEGIRVNSVSFGPFPRYDVQRQNKGFITTLESRVPMGKVGQAHEVGGPVVFLASPASSFVNGANLVVDGGWTAW